MTSPRLALEAPISIASVRAAFVACLLACPLPGVAQEAPERGPHGEADFEATLASDPDRPRGRLSVSGFGTWMPGYHLPSARTHGTLSGETRQQIEEWDMPARRAYGAEAAYDLTAGLRMLAGFRREGTAAGGLVCDPGAICLLPSRTEGPLTVAHLAPGWTSGGPVPVTAYVGPSLSIGATSASRFGIMMGAFADLPTPLARVSVRLAVEDRIAFWKNDAPDPEAGPRADPGSTHLLAFRAGLAYWP